MRLVALQKAAAQAIVNIFETGSIHGDYSDVTLVRGDAGQLTYGRSQTTLASGNLYILISDYVARSDGAYSAGFKPYLPALEVSDPSLNTNMDFRGLLRDAGSDPVMHDVQDAFFDRIYWDPAMRSADALGAATALGATIVYDSTVHGNWAFIRDRVRKKYGELSRIGESSWMQHYVAERRDWLATNANPLLHKTVYRMDAFAAVIHSGNWDLKLPLIVRGFSISPDTLSDTSPVKVPADEGQHRLLQLKAPPMAGADVNWLQERLTRAGFHVNETGTFDSATDAAVRSFQQSQNLKADGLVGPVTRAALEDVSVTTPAKTATADEPMPPAPHLAQPAPAATTVAPAVSSVSGTGAVADIKQHVTNEVRTGVETIRQTVKDEHQQLTTNISHALTGKAPAVAPPKAQVTKAPVATPANVAALQALLQKGRPGLAAALSAVMLALTEARDALAWVQAGPFSIPTKQPLPPAPTNATDIPTFLAQSYNYLQVLASNLPNEWLFRVRVAALALIAYALYRVIRRHYDLKNLQQALQQAQALEQDVASVVK